MVKIKNVNELCGDRFADIVDYVKLNESITHILPYIKEIINNDTDNMGNTDDTEAKSCLKVLKSLKISATEYISNIIE